MSMQRTVIRRALGTHTRVLDFLAMESIFKRRVKLPISEETTRTVAGQQIEYVASVWKRVVFTVALLGRIQAADN